MGERGEGPAKGDSAMRFAVLGPLAVIDGGDEIPVSSPVHRILLAMLLLHANKAVSADLLAEAIWDGAPPITAKASLQNHVMRLRRALGSAGERLVTRAPGYLIEVRDGELDLDRFTALRAAGRAAARKGAWRDAAHALSAAIDQWSGDAVGNVRSSNALSAQAQRLTELRLQAVELRLEADLQRGQHTDVIGELRALTAMHPLRERFHELLMLALYADGRQAEALAAYRDIRTTLVENFGIEPGRRIKQRHQQMLAADPALAELPRALADDRAAADEAASVSPDHIAPRQLPRAVSSFVGRKSELGQLARWLDRWLGQPGHAPASPLTVVICGTAGVGKTTLAVNWAHEVADLFPGGQLHIDLRGFAPAAEPTDPAEAIRCLLDALGVPADRIPANGQARVGLYRSLLADRERVLVLLDNARDAEQVRPLLPAAAGCLAIVTSRGELAGLAAVDGAEVLALDVLSDKEARQLLANRLGANLVASEAAAVDELSRLCARLPLALAVAAARAALPSGPTLARLVAELRDVRSRLDALDTGDQASSVRVVLSWSYRSLSAPAARMFRLLGLLRGPDISITAAASLAGAGVDDVRRLLIELTKVQLLANLSATRFAQHDLLRAYAAERAEAEDNAASRSAALRRLLDFYVHTGNAADRLLCPARDRLPLGPPSPEVMPEPLTGQDQAARWFEAEYEGLLAAVFQAGAAGFGEHAWQLAWVLSDFLERQGHWTDWARVQRAALAAASNLGDVAGLARAHRALGSALVQLGSSEEARSHLTAALDAYRQIDDEVGQARVSLDLAWLAERDGGDAEALRYAEHALDLFTNIGHRAGQGRALNVVGWYYARMGEARQAISPCERAVAICAELGDQVGEAAAWDSLGYCHRLLEDFPAAIACADRAVALTGLVGDRYHQADALVRAGDTHHAAGDLAAARDAWQQGMLILDDLHHPDAKDVRRKLADGR